MSHEIVKSNAPLVAERNLSKMAENHYDVLVVGGGISGATIAWDASLRGLKVALVDKADFSSGTSSASSKMVHGGLRYLANGEIGLVREALGERRIWERIAPHMVDPLPFLIPLYQSKTNKWVLQIGLILYDILSLDRTWLKDPAKRLPRHRMLSPAKALDRAPDLTKEGLLGALLYYDCQMYSPERLALECILGTVANGGAAANYAEVTDFIIEANKVEGAIVLDQLSGESHQIKADVTINASGPWADLLLRLAQGDQVSKHLLRSKGIHILTRELSPTTAFMLQAEEAHVFVLPWRGKTLIGTTDTAFRQHPNKVGVTEADIDILLHRLNIALPAAHLKRSDVLYAFAGLRPLIDTEHDQASDDPDETYSASRKAEVVDHLEDDGMAGLISALGGKWTTSRHVAEKVVDLLVSKLPNKDGDMRKSETAKTPTLGGTTGIYSKYLQGLKLDHPDWDEEIIEHLAKFYGARAPHVIDLAESDDLKARLTSDQPTIEAEVIFALRHEMGITLSDILLRRTELGTLGAPSQGTLNRLADLVAGEQGWDLKEKSNQLQQALMKYEVFDGAEE